MKRLCAGIVGMGFVGPIHMEAVQRLGFVNVAIASSSPEKARKASDKFHVDKAYGDWLDLVKDPTVDVIHICAPNNLHFPIARMALSRGKHVICDKPLTLTLKESEELVELAEKTGLVNAVTFNMAYYPMVQQARGMVLGGEIGKVNYVSGYYLQDWLSRDSDYNWRVEAQYQGSSRVVGDIGVHCLHMLQEVIGARVSAVYADLNTFVKTRKKPTVEVATFSSAGADQPFEDVEVDTEDQAALLLRFEDGTKGVFYGGQVFAGRKNRIGWEIYGSDRSLAWNGEEPNQIWVGIGPPPTSS